MKFVVNRNALTKINAEVDDALKVVGALGASFVDEQIRENKSIVTSNLINSITYSTQKVNPTGKNKAKTQLTKAPKKTVHIGTDVVYGARVEFGFIGRDVLGRLYNQKPKSYLRVGLFKHWDDLKEVFNKMVNT